LRRTADPSTAFTVVGVVGDVRNTALNQESPALYYPMAARVAPYGHRRAHRLGAIKYMKSTRTRVGQCENHGDQWVSNNAAQPRINAVLLGAFAIVALLIATIGIYGVLAYSVNQRTREIGLRMALGSTSGGVLHLIVGEGMKVVLAGIGIGLLGGFALGRVVSSLLFGVGVRDPVIFGAVAVVLTSVGLAACAIPAHRASRIDAVMALSDE
jgi:putative ABC transport system permease protein